MKIVFSIAGLLSLVSLLSAQQPVIPKKPDSLTVKSKIQLSHIPIADKRDPDNTGVKQTQKTNPKDFTVTVREKYKPGDWGQGGVIFWVDETGVHGLVASPAIVFTKKPVGPGLGIDFPGWAIDPIGEKKDIRFSNATRDGIYGGVYNTEHILAVGGPGYTLADTCAKTMDGIFGDWYWPSKYELSLMFTQKNLIGGFTDDLYLSSTEVKDSTFWAQSFRSGVQVPIKTSGIYSVRAIRRF